MCLAVTGWALRMSCCCTDDVGEGIKVAFKPAHALR